MRRTERTKVVGSAALKVFLDATLGLDVLVTDPLDEGTLGSSPAV